MSVDLIIFANLAERPQSGKPDRHIDTLTELGRELPHDLLCALPPEVARDQNAFLAWVGESLVGESLVGESDAASVARQRLSYIPSLEGSTTW